MLAFEKTAFYVPTGTGCESWSGQLGGIEGLHQYTWVVLYGAALRLTLEQVGFKAETLVRGDDWIAAIHVPNQALIAKGFPAVVELVKRACHWREHRHHWKLGSVICSKFVGWCTHFILGRVFSKREK